MKRLMTILAALACLCWQAAPQARAQGRSLVVGSGKSPTPLKRT